MRRIEWSKVTWYSRLLAAVVFILVFLAGVIYGVAYEKIRVRSFVRELEQKRDIVNWLDRVNLIRAAERNQRGQ